LISFHAYLTDSPAACAGQLSGPGNRRAESARRCRSGAHPSLVTDVFGKVQHWFLESTHPAELWCVHQLTEAALDAALEKAF